MLFRIFSPLAPRAENAILDIIKTKREENRKIYLIVPEQLAVESEKALVLRCGAGVNLNTEVVNFSRLSNTVLRNIGSLARNYIDDIGKSLVMARVMDVISPDLKEYKNMPKPDFILRLLNQTEEFFSCGITPEELERLSKDETEDVRLKNKLGDLAMIISAYKKTLGESFDDPSDELTRLDKILETNDFFKDSYVFISGFWDFTIPEYRIIRRIMSQCRDMYVGFCSDNKKNLLFAKSDTAAKKIARFAAQLGKTVKDLYCREEGEERDIDFLCKNLLVPSAKTDKKPEGIFITSCRSLFEEALYCAGKIRELVLKGARYSEIAVTFRNGEENDILDLVFEKYKIPHFSEIKRPLLNFPPVIALSRAVAIACGDLRLNTFRNYLKTGFCGLDPHDAFLLENYAITWNINGRIWLDSKGFVMNPKGFSEKFTEEDEAILNEINAAKEKLGAPLKRFAACLEAKTIKEKTAAVLGFLEDIGAEEKISQKAQALKDENKFSEAAEEIRLWNAFISCLERLGTTLGECEIPSKRFADYLTLAFSYSETGRIPPVQDRVRMGRIDFVRLNSANYIFVMGLNNGVFPAEESEGGLLTERERQILFDKGYEIKTGGFEEQVNEYFLFYTAARAAEKGLYCSYRTRAESALNGAGALSVIGRRIKNMFSGLKEENFIYEESMPLSKEAAFDCLIARFNERGFLKEKLYEYFSSDPEYSKKLESLEKGFEFLKSPARLAKNLPYFNKDISMTQSRLDEYAKCGFSFFSKYLIDAKQTGRTSFDANKIGTFVHAMLERFLRSLYLSGKTLSDITKEEREKALNEIVSEYISKLDTGHEGKGARLRYLIEKIMKSLNFIIDNLTEEFKQCEFVPFMFEAEIGKEIKPYEIPLDDGTSLKLYGNIDRVDVYKNKKGETFVRVVDYKTGTKKFSLTDVLNGLNIQMLVYLFALCGSEIKVRPNKAVKPAPAGILYLNNFCATPICKTRDERDKYKSSPQIAARDGLLVNDKDILAAMEPTLGGRFIPVKTDSRGAIKANNLATLEEFGKIKRYTEKLFSRMAKMLKSGEININPFYGCREESCKYCPYMPICKYEGKGVRNKIRLNTREEIFSKMEEEPV